MPPTSDGEEGGWALGAPAVRASGLAVTVQVDRETRLDLLSDVDLTVEAGRSVAVIGRSGSGKTTFLSVLGLLRGPTRGRLWIGEEEVSQISAARRARLRNELIGFVFQNYSLVDHLTVQENVALPLTYRQGGGRVSRREVRDTVLSRLDAVGMADFARRRPAQLSGGEQQRVAIARALVCGPRIVLADEPTGALDTQTGGQVLDVLQGATRHAGACLVVVTHDDDLARSMDARLKLDAGALTDVGVAPRQGVGLSMGRTQ